MCTARRTRHTGRLTATRSLPHAGAGPWAQWLQTQPLSSSRCRMEKAACRRAAAHENSKKQRSRPTTQAASKRCLRASGWRTRLAMHHTQPWGQRKEEECRHRLAFHRMPASRDSSAQGGRVPTQSFAKKRQRCQTQADTKRNRQAQISMDRSKQTQKGTQTDAQTNSQTDTQANAQTIAQTSTQTDTDSQTDRDMETETWRQGDVVTVSVPMHSMLHQSAWPSQWRGPCCPRPRAGIWQRAGMDS